MRVTDVDMYSANIEEPISFSLVKDEPNAQYMVRTILGLDAEDIAPRFYGQSLYTKSKFYDFNMKPRDIVMRVVLKPRVRINESYSDVRDELYRTIYANRTGRIKLHFRAGGTTIAGIFGQIVKFEAVHFTKLPEVQLTVRCNDPLFTAINPVIFAPGEVSETNPVLIPDSLSTAPHGFVAQLTATATVASFTMQDVQTNPEWKFKVIPSGGFASGDILYFSSESSNRYIYRNRLGTITQLADRIEPTSMWPLLFPGQNEFYIPELASFNWNNVQYSAAYWGV